MKSRHPGYGPEIEAYYGRWSEMFGGAIEGSVSVLRDLRERGRSLYALMNWSAETFPLAREQYHFLEWFEDVVVSGEEGIIKPEREIYDRLIERTGLDPAASVFVDDREENVHTAEELGFAGVVFREPAELEKELSILGLLQADGSLDA